MPIPLFLNPSAGRGRARRIRAALVELLAASDVTHHLVESQGPGDLEKKIKSAVAEGATQLLVAGGDGSIHEAVNGMLESGRTAEIGIIPLGRANDFAKACAIPPHWEDAALLLVDRLKNAMPARPVDIGWMNGRWFANGAGIGFDAKATAIARSMQLPIGDLVYLVAVVRGLLGGVSTYTVKIDFAGDAYEGAATLVHVSNGPWVAGLFQIAPSAVNDDGELDLLVVKPVSRLRVATLLPKLIGGKHIGEPEITHARIDRCEVMAAEPIPSHLDGEAQPLQTRFRIEMRAGALPLL
ncbi:MAG TPA: diacylglycerol kinase family protein [Woeseiaceae bacterium]|jgi:diacylglycerol kinase (ATP)|nr:diacylglycerol kinase family protein [Woeseiaceae bacterium]